MVKKIKYNFKNVLKRKDLLLKLRFTYGMNKENLN